MKNGLRKRCDRLRFTRLDLVCTAGAHAHSRTSRASITGRAALLEKRSIQVTVTPFMVDVNINWHDGLHLGDREREANQWNALIIDSAFVQSEHKGSSQLHVRVFNFVLVCKARHRAIFSLFSASLARSISREHRSIRSRPTRLAMTSLVTRCLIPSSMTSGDIYAPEESTEKQR